MPAFDRKKWGQFRQWAVSQGIDPAALDSFYAGKVEAESVRSGLTKVGDIPAAQRTGVLESLLGEDWKPADEETAKEKELGRMYAAAISLVDELEADYQFSNAGQFGEGLEARKRGGELAISARKGEDWTAQNYIDRRKAFSSSLKTVVGEAGPMTKDDIDRLTNIFPNISLTASSTGAESYGKFAGARKQLAKYFGEEPTETTWNINNPTPEQRTQIEKRYGVKLPEGVTEPIGPTAPTAPSTEPTTTAPPTGLSQWLSQQPDQMKRAAWSVGGPLAQMYGGKAENLPKVGATLGGLLGLTVGHPHIGAGVGYAGGERVKQLATGGQVGDIEAQKQAALKGVGAGVLSKVGQLGVEKIAAPVIGRVASKPLQWLLQKTGGRVTAPTETLAETAAGLKGQAPPGFQEEVGKEMAPFTRELYGKLYGGEKTMNLLPYRQQLSGKYDELSKYGGQALYKDITGRIHQEAPATKLVDWLLSSGYKQVLPDWLKRLGWGGAGVGTYQVGRKLMGR